MKIGIRHRNLVILKSGFAAVLCGKAVPFREV